MVRWLLAPALLLTLSGCFWGHCGLMPDAVVWDDPAFFAALGALDSSWQVEDRMPAEALPFENDAIEARLGASSLESVSWRPDTTLSHGDLGQEPYLSMASPRPSRGADPDAPTDTGPRVPRAILIASSNVTAAQLQPIMAGFLERVLNTTQTQSLVDEWLAAPTQMGYRFDGAQRIDMLLYSVAITDGLALEALFAALDPQPGGGPHSPRYESDGWSFSFQLVLRSATKGIHIFEADPLGFASYRGPWQGEVPEDQAIRDFAEAYAQLDLGPAPEEVRVHGAIC